MDGVDGFAVNEYVDRGEAGRIELIEALWHRYAGKAEWYICVDESWEVKVPKGAQVRGFRASEQPDRKEVLLVRAVTKDGHRMWHSYVMRRDEEGRLVDLVAEEGIDLQIQDTLEAPLFGTRIERLAPVFDPTTR